LANSLLVRAVFSLAIGALIGLERERFKKLAGLRSFMFTCLFGMLSAHLARTYSGFMLVSSFIIGAVIFAAYWARAQRSEKVGLTTVLALVVTFFLGALTEDGEFLLTASIAVLVTFALAGKIELSRFARKLTRQELLDALKFMIATIVVLPILPRSPIDPWGVFNPFEMWLLAVLVLSVSFVGYVIMKVLGPTEGIAALGFLGGIASSTALTSAMSERVRQTPKILQAGAFAILLASSTMFLRALMLLGALNAALAAELTLSFAGMAAFGGLICVVLWLRIKDKKASVPFGSSFAIMPALKFAVLYTIISFVSFFAKKVLGDIGLFGTALLAGLADIDVVVTSTATLLSHGEITINAASLAVFLGAVSNTFTKLLLVRTIGTRSLTREIGASFLLILLFGAGLFLLF